MDPSRDPLEKLREKMKSKDVSFSLQKVSVSHVKNIIKKLKRKKSCGFDELSSELLKMGSEALSKPLTTIINKSIEEGKFPEDWKVAKVCPLFKKGDRTEISNYRPVALLMVPSMVLERVVAIQIENFFEENALFGDFQFGFRRGKSTVSELIQLVDTLMEAKLDKKEICLILYDLSSAFDTVCPKVLIEKLKLYGFNSNAMSWISSYLNGRKQAVTINGEVSEQIELTLGTPQGSRLSPLLFLILMSDLNLHTDKSSLTNYADDTQSCIISDTQEETIKIAQAESNSVVSFFKGVNLVNNPKKSMYSLQL